MDLISQLRAFVATAQTGSFTAAAEQLKISNRLTSKYVAELEFRLGVRLFQRTTRKVGLTTSGEDLLARVPAILNEFDELLADVSERTEGLSGTIRISAPITFGEVYVIDMIAKFSAQHPDISVDLRLTDRYVDLAAEGIDLAFRLGSYDMASLKVRLFGKFSSVLVASPAYLEKFGSPKQPHDLHEHVCVVDTNRRDPQRWIFQKDGKEFTVNVGGRFHVNSAKAARDLAIRGHGVTYIPQFALGETLENGTLVSLLNSYSGQITPLGAVYLGGRSIPRKVRALIDFAVIDIKTANILK